MSPILGIFIGLAFGLVKSILAIFIARKEATISAVVLMSIIQFVVISLIISFVYSELDHNWQHIMLFGGGFAFIISVLLTFAAGGVKSSKDIIQILQDTLFGCLLGLTNLFFNS